MLYLLRGQWSFLLEFLVRLGRCRSICQGRPTLKFSGSCIPNDEDDSYFMIVRPERVKEREEKEQNRKRRVDERIRVISLAISGLHYT